MLHEDPNFASIPVHEEVVDLVDVVRLLDEHDKFLLFVTRSFHSTFEYFFCRNRPGIRVFESLLESQRESIPFVAPGESQSVHFQSCVSEFLGSARDLCHGKQRVSPFYHGSESCFQGQNQSDPINREREYRPISIQRPKR